MVFLKDFFEIVDFEKISRQQKSIKNFPGGNEFNTISSIILPKIKVSSLRNYTGGTELYAHAFLRTRRYAPVIGILTFISMIYTITESFKLRHILIFQHIIIC